VIAGNLFGGSVLVALVYYVIYVRPARLDQAGARGRNSASAAAPRPTSVGTSSASPSTIGARPSSANAGSVSATQPMADSLDS
jgi:hypothetical protein